MCDRFFVSTLNNRNIFFLRQQRVKSQGLLSTLLKKPFSILFAQFKYYLCNIIKRLAKKLSPNGQTEALVVVKND